MTRLPVRRFHNNPIPNLKERTINMLKELIKIFFLLVLSFVLLSACVDQLDREFKRGDYAEEEATMPPTAEEIFGGER